MTLVTPRTLEAVQAELTQAYNEWHELGKVSRDLHKNALAEPTHENKRAAGEAQGKTHVAFERYSALAVERDSLITFPRD